MEVYVDTRLILCMAVYSSKFYYLLTWSRNCIYFFNFVCQLCRNALTWAKTLAKDDKFVHQPDNPFGENLFSIWSSNQVTARDAICNWYKAGKDYDYSREPRIIKSGNDHSTRSNVRDGSLKVF